MIGPLLLCGSVAVMGQSPQREVAARQRQFETHIRPVLEHKCLKCHGPDKQEGELRLDSLAAMLKGGGSGPAIAPGKPAESLLMEAIRYEGLEMPPDGRLPEKEVEQFAAWIASDAPWPDHGRPLRPAAGAVTDEDRQWWAFRPLTLPPIPMIEDDRWSRNPIDRFVYRRLHEHGLLPAPQADKVRLVRRLYFDLIGLPPSPDEIDEFVNSDDPGAYEALVDRLLADERYGEHWAQYWLDLVRYAESDGWNQDAFRPHIWRYRDFVVSSFNRDTPYPKFVRQQLAGDEMPGDDPENQVAAGYLRLGIYEYNQRDARGHWNDIMNEMTDVTGDVFLGMGMACARCHDHKFDPLLQQDYFKLRAFFEPVIWRDDLHYATQQQLEKHRLQLAKWEEATADVRARIDQLLKPYHDRKWESTVDKFPLDIQACFKKPVEKRTSWEHQMAYMVDRQFYEEGGGPLKSIKKEDQAKYDGLKKELAEFDEMRPKPLAKVMTATDFSGPPSPTVIPDDPQQTPVAPGFPTVLSGVMDSPGDSPSEPDGRRSRLADWIGQPDNPLTTRVIVNRIWQQHFGRGIVPTSSDFGHLGQPPTHPQLLDWLTVTFVENGWSMKQLHKMILMSATWQQSTTHSEAAEYEQQDAATRLLWRARVRRLTAEQIRDGMLAASGELQGKLGGPSVGGDVPRRSLYLKSLRNTPHEFLHAFDRTTGLKSVAERNNTTTPTQSLLMINGDFALKRAAKLAERLVAAELGTNGETISVAFRLTWGREPSTDELARSLAFVEEESESESPALDKQRLVDFCHVLLNANEFAYLE